MLFRSITNYYDTVNEEELIDAAINGMLDYLDDPYTTYLNEFSKESLMDSLKGTYEGIGIEILKTEEGPIEIVKIFENTPASKAGIAVGDILKVINEVDLTDKNSEEAVAIIKGAKDGDVNITVARGEELLSFSLKKETLYVPVITSRVFESNNQKIGYLAINKFSSIVGEQFNEKLKNLEGQGINSLIIDVRNNTGGYLKGAGDIASLFLKDGDKIYSLQTKTETKHYKDETAESRNYKVSFLINKGAASASEVLAAAMKYSYNATLVGVTSYGKGSVQQTSDLTEGSMLKYTTAKWLTPNGDCIDGIGLIPDVEAIMSEAYYENPSEENDNQLQTAIYEISK